MAIVVKYRPSRISAKDRDRVLRMIRNDESVWGDYKDRFYPAVNGVLIGNSGGKFEGMVRLYNLEKHNPKAITHKRVITRGKRKGEVEVTREVIRQGKWVAHYYDIPKDMIDMAGTRQFTRYFKIKLK